MVMTRRQHPLIWIAALLAIALGTVWQQRDRAVEAPAQQAEKPEQEQRPAEAQKPAQMTNDRIDAVVRDAEERAELQKTLDLIARGGPFPYPNDGGVFSNRERRLPQHERGYYREYTVVTPRAQNRGARRVIRGNDGETYYTRDHYRTFERID
jgi:guanyl-specific ribonuclease Sa